MLNYVLDRDWTLNRSGPLSSVHPQDSSQRGHCDQCSLRQIRESVWEKEREREREREREKERESWATHRAGESEPRPTSGTTSRPTSGPTSASARSPTRAPTTVDFPVFISLSKTPTKRPTNASTFSVQKREGRWPCRETVRDKYLLTGLQIFGTWIWLQILANFCLLHSCGGNCFAHSWSFLLTLEFYCLQSLEVFLRHTFPL